MIFCRLEWNGAASVCARCGRTTQCPPEVKFGCPRCVHLGVRIDTILVRCTSCAGNVRLKTPVFNCAIHGRCLPTYEGEPERGYAACHGCRDYVAAHLNVPS